MKAWGLLAAAGVGERLGSVDGVPKAMRALGGVPMYRHGLRTFDSVKQIEGVALVVPVNWLEHTLATMLDRNGGILVELRPGGDTRAASVRAGLASIPEDVEAIVIHDAARPLATPTMVEDALAALEDADGAVVAVPASDTMKRTRGDRILRTVPREGLWRAQTPQAFRAGVLRDAHEHALAEDLEATDDATLVERRGRVVVVVPGDERNIKITTASDLALAETLLREDPR